MQQKRSLPNLSAAQTEIMAVVWEHTEVTVVQLCALLASRRTISRNTVQTQLTRLVEKGWLAHRVEGKTYFYRATLPQHAAQSDFLSRLVDVVFKGSPEGVIMNLLEDRKLSKEAADRIRAMIERAEEDPS